MFSISVLLAAAIGQPAAVVAQGSAPSAAPHTNTPGAPNVQKPSVSKAVGSVLQEEDLNDLPYVAPVPEGADPPKRRHPDQSQSEEQCDPDQADQGDQDADQ